MATANTDSGFPLKTALAVATVAIALTVWHWRVRPSSGMDWHAAAELPKLPFLTHKAAGNAAAGNLPVSNAIGSGATQPAQNAQSPDALLIDDSASLDRFYAALAKLDAHTPDARATIIHFGDSPTTADLITGDVRQQLQSRFGDAGQGFNLVAKPWAWYQHFNIDASDKGWKYTTAVGTMREGQWGIGGAAFDGSIGAESRFKLTGSDQTVVEVIYQTQPGGGSFAISADNGANLTQSLPTIDTAGPQALLAFKSIPLPPATRAVNLHVTQGAVRLYGILFERATPGVVYDSIGLNGATTSVVARALNEEMMRQSFRHLAPTLVVINFGTNESSFGSFVDRQYEGELRLAIARIRRTAPDADILIMSPMDRGERTGGSGIATMATIPRIVAIQQRVAADTGCGFFNTFKAMGGEGTMERWYDHKPRLVGGDLIHPSPQGAKIVAAAFIDQLMHGYQRYQLRRPDPRSTVVAAGKKANSPQPSP